MKNFDITSFNAKQIHILEYSVSEFTTEGYTGGSTNIIAKKAKVAKGLIFHYFGSKDKLFYNTLCYAYFKCNRCLQIETASLSTFMETFELMSELLKIKHSLIYLEPDYAPLLLNSFVNTVGYPDELRIKIQGLERTFNELFASYLDAPLSSTPLRPQIKKNPDIFQKIFKMLDAAFEFEKNTLDILSMETIGKINMKEAYAIIQTGIYK